MLNHALDRRSLLAVMAALAAAGAAPAAANAAGEVGFAPNPLIARIWHGRTPAAKAEEYAHYLFDSGVKKIAGIVGNRGVQMMRAESGDEAEFMIISYWDSIDAIKRFAGEDYTKTHDLPRDHEFLIAMEPKVRHLQLAVNFWQG
jgi:heme-degrading monooxygenase HmoA